MQATAYVVGPSQGSGARLLQVARGLGFETVLPYAGVALAEQRSHVTPVMFFLFAAVADVDALKPVAEAIRFSPTRRVRFSPLVYFTEAPSLDSIRRCIFMGFDDIVTLPFAPERIVERLRRQIDRVQIYYETSGYFGPDRRNRMEEEAGDSRRSGGRHRRMEIIRHPENGVSVLRDTLHGA